MTLQAITLIFPTMSPKYSCNLLEHQILTLLFWMLSNHFVYSSWNPVFVIKPLLNCFPIVIDPLLCKEDLSSGGFHSINFTFSIKWLTTKDLLNFLMHFRIDYIPPICFHFRNSKLDPFLLNKKTHHFYAKLEYP